MDSVSDVRELLEELIGRYGIDLDISLSIGSMKRQAAKYSPENQEIRVSDRLVERHPGKVEEILKHELGHAIVIKECGKDAKPHGEEWKSAMEEMGVENPEATHDLDLAEYRYVIVCSNEDCDMKMGRHRRSKLVKNVGLYRCKDCGGTLKRKK